MAVEEFLESRLAHDHLSLVSRSSQRRQQHTDQQGDDGHNNQHFDQRERMTRGTTTHNSPFSNPAYGAEHAAIRKPDCEALANPEVSGHSPEMVGIECPLDHHSSARPNTRSNTFGRRPSESGRGTHAFPADSAIRHSTIPPIPHVTNPGRIVNRARRTPERTPICQTVRDHQTDTQGWRSLPQQESAVASSGHGNIGVPG